MKDTNANPSEFCNECLSDDRREDHSFKCDCYCHHPRKIRQLQSRIAKLEAVKEAAKEFINSLQPQNAKAYDGLKPLWEALATLDEGDKK